MVSTIKNQTGFLRRYFDNEKYYFKYKKNVLDHTEKVSLNESTEHFTNLVNYCIVKNISPKKNEKFRDELINLYDIILYNDYFITEKIKYLPNDLFRDVLFLGLKQKGFNWSLNFVMEYSKKLDPKEKEEVLEQHRKIWGKSIGLDFIAGIPEKLDKVGKFEDDLISIVEGKANPKATHLHESVHAAELAFLTDKERAELEKAEPDAE